jgi:ribosomal protein S18 acetylase RimI-like enzyme
MASTEGVDDARVVALTEAHLAGCLALSKSANWNQNAADWRLMLSIGRGWGIPDPERKGMLAASTLVLPYGSFAWVSMVLVLPEYRSQGLATRLLRCALADLKSREQAPILDATPAGHPVYSGEGFHDTWGFRRYKWTDPSRRQPATMPDVTIRPIGDGDWASVLRLDARAFGGSRASVLRDLARRRPQGAMLAHSGHEVTGFALGREGREAVQIGPVVAQDARTATALLGSALARAEPPVYVDLVDRDEALQAWLLARGFEFQRPFTRMVHGAPGVAAPGEASLVFCPAGPELG